MHHPIRLSHACYKISKTGFIFQKGKYIFFKDGVCRQKKTIAHWGTYLSTPRAHFTLPTSLYLAHIYPCSLMQSCKICGRFIITSRLSDRTLRNSTSDKYDNWITPLHFKSIVSCLSSDVFRFPLHD